MIAKVIQSAMSNMFWDIATSDLVLTIVAAVMVASFVVSHLPIVRDLPAVKPYAIAAGLIAYLALADLAFFGGYRISDERADAARLERDLDWSKNQLAQQKATADDAERIAKEKAAEADELKGKVVDYEKALAQRAKTDPGGSCVLSDDDISRLRALAAKRPKRR